MSRAQKTFTIMVGTMAALLSIGTLSVSAPACAQGRPQGQAPMPSAPADPQAIAPDFRQLRGEAGQVHSPHDLFVVLDVNQDGCIDESEWRRRVMAIFFILDTDGNDPITGRPGGDGKLTRAEVPNLREDLFRAADADHDGTISAFEFNQAGFTRFEAVPKQDPGCLTLIEFTVYLQGLRKDAF